MTTNRIREGHTARLPRLESDFFDWFLKVARHAWPSLLLLILWLTFAPRVWAGITAAVTQPGGSYALFFSLGTVVLALRLGRRLALVPVRSEVHAAPASLGGVARAASNHTPAPEVLRRRARHEAAHAIAAWAMGGRVLSLDIRSASSRGGQCISSLQDLEDPTERWWTHLVICMAGNQIDLAHEHRDDGSQADLVQALAAAAAIISTDRHPHDHDGDLTTDSLLASARARAVGLLDTHRLLVDRIVERLIEHPHEEWRNPDLEALR